MIRLDGIDLAIRVHNLLRFGILEQTSTPEVPPRVEFTFTPFGQRLMASHDQVTAPAP